MADDSTIAYRLDRIEETVTVVTAGGPQETATCVRDEE